MFLNEWWFDAGRCACLVLLLILLLSAFASAVGHFWRWLPCRKATVQFISPDGKRRSTKRLSQAASFRLMDAIDRGEYR